MKINDTQANHIALGNGQPVILIHGIAASLSDWTEFAPALASNGYSAYALDLLGHWDSAKPDDPRAYQIETLYQHFRDCVEGLDLDVPPILVGHSLGGYLGLVHSLCSPEQVRGLVLINPYYKAQQLSLILLLARRRPALSEKAMRFTPLWMIRAALGWNPEAIANFSPQTRQQIAVDYKRASPHFVYITHKIPDLTDQLIHINAPALIIWGERDQTLHPASFPQLVQALPKALGYSIRSAGHQPHISDPDLVIRVTLEFIRQWNTPSSPNPPALHPMSGDHFASA